jgi:hypothetical protein
MFGLEFVNLIMVKLDFVKFTLVNKRVFEMILT